MTRREIRDWKDAGRQVWWYVVKTNEFPYSYWSGERWGSSFRDYAAKYRTKGKAENVALLLAAQDASLIGVVDVIER